MRVPDGVPRLLEAHPDFMGYWARVLGLTDSLRLEAEFGRFVRDSGMQALEDSILRQFPSIDTYGRALSRAFAELGIRIPGLALPEIYFFNSGFNTDVLLAEGLLGLSLDRFLGPDSWYYPRLGMHQYLRRHTAPEAMYITAVTSWLRTEFPLETPRATVLDHMLYEGGLLWMGRQLFPDLPDSLVLAHSPRELRWLEESEGEMWAYLSDRRVLFETDPMLVAQFTRPAPFTTSFGNDSPGQAACWIGYRIVSEYMRRQGEQTTWRELLGQKSAVDLVEGARYQPRTR